MDITGNLLKIMKNFKSERLQQVVLNGQSSDWAPIRGAIPQGSILGSLLFLVYINAISFGFSSTGKLFVDDTSLFSITSESIATSKQLTEDLSKISQWAYQWKMLFNPDHPKVLVQTTIIQKHPGLHLDSKHNFFHHNKETICKVKKALVCIKTTSNIP